MQTVGTVSSKERESLLPQIQRFSLCKKSPVGIWPEPTSIKVTAGQSIEFLFKKRDEKKRKLLKRSSRLYN